MELMGQKLKTTFVNLQQDLAKGQGGHPAKIEN